MKTVNSQLVYISFKKAVTAQRHLRETQQLLRTAVALWQQNAKVP